MSAGNGRRKKPVTHSDTVDITPKPRKGVQLPFRLVVNTDPRADLHRRTSGNQIDPRRNFGEECGWPERIATKDYFDMHERNDYANRVNTIYPDECWAVAPDVYETDRPRNTDFEKDVLAMMEHDEEGVPVDPETNLRLYWHMADIRSGIGGHGGLLYGIDDGRKLREPAAGLDPVTGVMDEARPEKRRLLFLRALDEQQLWIEQKDASTNSPRFGKPTLYRVTIQDPVTGSSYQEHVHWTRIIHLADGGEVHGVPRTRVVFNRLLDVLKIMGGGAEMFYQGGFPGLAFTLDPKMIEGGNFEIDEDAIEEQMWLYANRLQRYLDLSAYQVKSLAPNIADPKGNLEGQLQAIATAIGVPLRILLGAEQAQLASGQDVRTWNRRLTRRQNHYLTPKMIRPTIDRLIAVGIIRPPKKGLRAYKVAWPDVNMPNADEQSTVADRIASAMMKYVQGKVWKVMQPSDWLRLIIGRTQGEVDVIIANSKKEPELDLEEPLPVMTGPGVGGKKPVSKPPSSGVKGNPPSKPPAGGRT